jgi:hypothetical protein
MGVHAAQAVYLFHAISHIQACLRLVWLNAVTQSVTQSVA